MHINKLHTFPTVIHNNVSFDYYVPATAGDDPVLDIVPVSGTLQYISGVTQQSITLSINPDIIPEIAEVCIPSLQ